MARNITWCLMSNIIKNSNLMRVHCLSAVKKHFKHTHEGDDGSLQNPVNIDYREVKSYKQFLNESKACPQTAIAALMRALDVTKENAIKIVDHWKIFGTLSIVTIMTNNSLLRKAGANKSTLRQNMFALADTSSNLRKKIKTLEFVELEVNSAIPLFQLSEAQLSEFMFTTSQDRKHLVDHMNRVSYLSDRLKQDIYELCTIICRARYMLKIPITKLIPITEFLLESGLPGETIVRDLQVYRYSTRNIRERFEFAKKTGITILKPWMVRCPKDLIEIIGSRLHTRESIMTMSVSLVNYISQEFNCDTESVEALIKRDPTIQSMNIEKLLPILKTLSDCGYTIGHIYRAPRSLHTSVETLKKRYDIWMQHNKHKPSLSYISSTDKIFNNRLNIELKNRK